MDTVYELCDERFRKSVLEGGPEIERLHTGRRPAG